MLAVTVEPTSSTDGVLDEKALREVTVANDEQLEAIAEEVQASWRLKEIRVEALLQKAVQARPHSAACAVKNALSEPLLRYGHLRICVNIDSYCVYHGVQASERPWLILLSTLFTATVVLLTLVLWRLYILQFGGSF